MNMLYRKLVITDILFQSIADLKLQLARFEDESSDSNTSVREDAKQTPLESRNCHTHDEHSSNRLLNGQTPGSCAEDLSNSESDESEVLNTRHSCATGTVNAIGVDDGGELPSPETHGTEVNGAPSSSEEGLEREGITDEDGSKRARNRKEKVADLRIAIPPSAQCDTAETENSSGPQPTDSSIVLSPKSYSVFKNNLIHVPEMNLPWSSMRNTTSCVCGVTFSYSVRKVCYICSQPNNYINLTGHYII